MKTETRAKPSGLLFVLAVLFGMLAAPIQAQESSNVHPYLTNKYFVDLGVFFPDLIHHSDRGVQYLSDDFQGLLKANGITCSMSDRGSCYDNAVVESFFASLKRERIKRRKYRTRDEARADVFDYIERFYNRKRRHGYVGNISPVQFENRTMRA